MSGEVKRVLFSGKTIALLIILTVFCVWQYTNQYISQDQESLERYAAYRELIVSACEWPAGTGTEKIEEILAEIREDYQDGADNRDNWIRESAALLVQTQVSYLDGYASYLEKIKKEAAYIQKGGVFGPADGFPAQNAAKTVQDYAKMDSTAKKLRLIPVTGFESIVKNDLTGFFAAAFGLYLVLCLIRYQKRGLWEMIYALPKGRMKYALKQMLVLLLGSILCVSLLYGMRIAASIYWFGENEYWSFPVQCSELYESCTLPVSVWEMLMLNWIGHGAAAFAAALLFWMICLVVRQEKLALLVCLLISVLEYVLYVTISASSSLVMLRVLNLVSVWNLQEVFRTYLNLSVFGRPAGQSLLCVLWIVMLTAAGMGGGIALTVHRHPKNASGFAERISDGAQRAASKTAGRFPAVFSELRKLLFFEHGILVIVLFGWFAYTIYAGKSVLYLYVSDGIRDQIYQEMAGRTAEEAKSWLDQKKAENDAVLAGIKQLQSDYQDGKIPYEEYAYALVGTSGVGYYAQAYEEAQADLERILALSQDCGKTIHMVSPYGVERLAGVLDWKKDDMDRIRYKKRIRWCLYELVTLVFLLAGIFPIEKKTKMARILAALPGGREKLNRRKCRMAAGVVGILWLAGSIMQVLQVIRSGGSFSGLLEPAAVLEVFSGVPAGICLGAILAGIFLLRLVLLLCVTGILLGIGSCCSSTAAAAAIGSVLLLVPAAAEYLFGIPGMLLAVLDAVQNLWERPAVMAAQTAVLLILGITGFRISRSGFYKKCLHSAEK